MVKVRQKVSGGFRTDRGDRIFLTTRSYTGTLRKQGRDVWSGLTQAMKGLPFLPSEAGSFPLDFPEYPSRGLP